MSKHPLSIRISLSEAVRRAQRIAALKHSRYKLGAGGRNPAADNPFTVRDGVLGCDCIGFVLWCLGLDRFQPDFPYYGGWINTDSAIMDGDDPQAYFEVTDQPRAGDLVVFPGIFKNGKRVRIGHVGLVVGTTIDTSEWTSNLWKRPKRERARFLKHVKVIDCAAAMSRRLLGRAVRETTAAASWNKPDAVFLRYKHAVKSDAEMILLNA